MNTTLFQILKKKTLFCKLALLLFALKSFNCQAQQQMTKPFYLQKGDTVAFVSTARKSIDDGLKPAIELLHSWGLEVKIGNTIGLENNQLAGTDEQRAADFQQQLDNPNIKAIWCSKGGYGTVRMVDLVDFTKFKQQPKWIIGFSDVTVMHNHLSAMGYQSIHALMPGSIPRATPEAISSLKASLFGEPISYTVAPDVMNGFGKATGELVGGNLSIIYSMTGSVSAINCKNKILFIEDLDEYLYHIDRMMMNLKRNGCLESVKGIIIGGMTKMKDNDIPWGKNALEIVDDVTKKYNIPVIFNFPAGHIQDNRALVMGATITMEVNTAGSTVNFK